MFKSKFLKISALNAIKAFATLVLVASFAVAAIGCGPSDEERIRTLVDEQFSALANADVSSLTSSLPSEVTTSLSAAGIDPTELVTTYLNGFSYRIDEVTVDKDTAEAKVTLYANSLTEALNSINDIVANANGSSDLANSSAEEVVSYVSSTFMEALKNQTPTDRGQISIHFQKNKEGNWEASDDLKGSILQALTKQ